MYVCESCSILSNSLQPHGLYSLWTSQCQNIGVRNLSLLQGIFPTQRSNPGLPHCRQILYQLSHKRSPVPSHTWCEELPLWKKPWFWRRLKSGGEGNDRGWDGWIASLTLWTWVWVSSGSWWWTGKPGMLQSMGSQRVGQNWMTELNW